MEQRKRELDNWDSLVEKTINSLQPPSILQEMDHHCRQNNRLTSITVAKFQVFSTWNSQDNPSKSIEPQALLTWNPQYEHLKKRPKSFIDQPPS